MVMAATAAAMTVAAVVLPCRGQQVFQFNQPANRVPLVVVGAVDPGRQHRTGVPVLKSQADLVQDLVRVERFQDIGRRFSRILVADGNLAGDRIGQRVHKKRRRSEFLHGRREIPVIGQGAETAENQHGAVFPGHKTVRILFHQQFCQQKAQLAGGVHLEKLGIIAYMLPVQIRE